jgi:hypothetical protein
MPSEARMAEIEMGYETEIRAMSAKTRMAAREKGSKARSGASNNKIGIKWENQYAEFARCVVEVRTKLYYWQENQLSNGSKGLNAKIKKALAENEGSTVWSDQRERLDNCIAQKKCNAHNIKWESKFAEFESYDGMPAVGTTLYTWQMHQLSNEHASLNAKIQKELAENEGSTVWSDQRERLDNCVAQKRSSNDKIGNKWC